MRNIWITPAILLSLLLCCSCVEIEVKTKLNENGSGTQQWKFKGTGILASEIKKQVENNRFFKGSIIRDQFKDGDYTLDTEKSFQDVSELRNPDRDIRYVSEGYFIKTHTYTEVWKRTGEPAGLLAQHAKGLVPVTLRVEIELPGSIIETNADWKEGSVARWSIPVLELATSKMLIAKSRSFNWLLLIPGAIVLFALFAVLVIAVYTAMRKEHAVSAPPVRCSACGANVPSGSTFCNFCGNKMME